MCKTHQGKFSCGHKIVDIRSQCSNKSTCKKSLDKSYRIDEKCSECLYGTKDTERDKAALHEHRKVCKSREQFMTPEGPRGYEIEVVPCKGGRDINLGLKKKKLLQEAQLAAEAAKSSNGWSPMRWTSIGSWSSGSSNGRSSLGGSSATGSSDGGSSAGSSSTKESPTKGFCPIM
ncbi:hypothetical protein TWF281_003828 [Arthrobotrys megalospora]